MSINFQQIGVPEEVVETVVNVVLDNTKKDASGSPIKTPLNIKFSRLDVDRTYGKDTKDEKIARDPKAIANVAKYLRAIFESRNGSKEEDADSDYQVWLERQAVKSVAGILLGRAISIQKAAEKMDVGNVTGTLDAMNNAGKLDDSAFDELQAKLDAMKAEYAAKMLAAKKDALTLKFKAENPDASDSEISALVASTIASETKDADSKNGKNGTSKKR